jgi:hypothetical protein
LSETAERLAEVQGRISDAAQVAGRARGSTRLIAVAKTATPETLEDAWEAGQRAFGHNRVQALEEHAGYLPDAEWHLLGPLQRNKAKDALRLCSFIHTIASERITDRLNLLMAGAGTFELPVCIQVNLTPEDGRAGCPKEDLSRILDYSNSSALMPVGLMTLGPRGGSPDSLRHHFAELRKLGEHFSESGQLPSNFELSMGMTEDFSIAVQEGATLVRVGRALFPPTKT